MPQDAKTQDAKAKVDAYDAGKALGAAEGPASSTYATQGIPDKYRETGILWRFWMNGFWDGARNWENNQSNL